MKLKRVYFDAFKSLLDKELIINEDCIGFVGTNESGKSNVLTAINVLGGTRKLGISDIPKMENKKNPQLRFVFELDSLERKICDEIVEKWCSSHTLLGSKMQFPNEIIYNVTYDKKEEKELRYFTMEGLKLDSNQRVLKYEKLNDPYRLKKGTFIPLKKAIIISEEDLVNDTSISNAEVLRRLYSDLEQVRKLRSSFEKQTEEISTLIQNSPQIDDGTVALLLDSKGATSDKNKSELETLRQGMVDIDKKIGLISGSIESLEKEVDGFNLFKIVEDEKKSLKELISNIELDNKAKDELVGKISEFETKDSRTPEDEEQVASIKEDIKKIELSIASRNKEKSNIENVLNALEEPVKDKYISDVKELEKYWDEIMQEPLSNMLPKVVFWAHNDKYILQSETMFSDLLNKVSLDDISRPLVNIFRVSLGIKTIEELKALIMEIQADSSERSRLQRKLNEKINEYIKLVWNDYNQDMYISLEKEQILIQIFDPSKKDASYYQMAERSQGCQVFLSFLLTIGAEAKHGVIKNNILILDEPETHLHPSGVRFMLSELIRISENKNIVLYATHSIFLIDKKNLNRHIILKKEKEYTTMQPANLGRIGYFTQEEVLYKALEVDIDDEFSSTKRYNFVFEGDGDVSIFQYYYDKIITKESRPYAIKDTAFFQGGKCSDIRKYFSHKPTHHNDKWFFVIDKDNAGNELKEFIERKYKEYLNKDFYIYQYSKSTKEDIDIELEDLLPIDLITSSYIDTAKHLNFDSTNIEKISTMIKENFYYSVYGPKILSLVNKADQELFKAKFKEALNTKIKGEYSKLRTEDEFKEKFQEYYYWVSKILSDLKPEKRA